MCGFRLDPAGTAAVTAFFSVFDINTFLRRIKGGDRGKGGIRRWYTTESGEHRELELIAARFDKLRQFVCVRLSSGYLDWVGWGGGVFVCTRVRNIRGLFGRR